MLSYGLNTSFREWVILAFHPPPSLYPLLLCCRERTMGLLRCPLHTPQPFSHTHLLDPFGIRTLQPLFQALCGLCLPSSHLPSFLCSGTVRVSVDCWAGSYSLVSSLFPSRRGWPWSLLLGPLTFPLRGSEASGAAWWPVPIHLHLTDINALHSLLMIVLVLGSCLYGSLLQIPVTVKHASRRKIPSNQRFPAGPFFDFPASPTPTPLHPILLGFILEYIYFLKILKINT